MDDDDLKLDVTTQHATRINKIINEPFDEINKSDLNFISDAIVEINKNNLIRTLILDKLYVERLFVILISKYNLLDEIDKQYNCTIIAIAILLENLPKEFNLNLRWNNLGDTGIKVLSEAFKKTTLPLNFSLNLEDSNISNKGAKALAKAINTTAFSLIYVNFSGNNIVNTNDFSIKSQISNKHFFIAQQEQNNSNNFIAQLTNH